MIEKLPFTEIHTGGEDMVDRIEFRPVVPYEMQHKINELVDKVNDLTTNLDGQARTLVEQQAKIAILEEHAHPTATTEPADPYAEQRKWVGKLCKFWYSNEKFADLGILQAITPANTPNHYLKKDSSKWYMCCEPVKPDDDIIYKGGDNGL